MEQALAAFRQFLTAEKRASVHTERAYLRDLEEFRAHARATLGREPALDELDVLLCRSYLASLHGKNDAVTIGRKLSSLRAFFRLAVRRRLCASSPVAALRAPKRAKRLPAFLGKEDVGRLLDGGARDEELGGDACARALEAALFEVIYGAGLRVSEACNLDL
ncbi:MAG TPA: site-specific integrase, partial [Polyangia bacterium]|nr:site-specific integrase [Polyangia bacterium]